MVILDNRLLIEKKIESKMFTQDFREHLGASGLGNQCTRQTWYSFRWSVEREIPATLNRLFGRGHSEEIIVVEDLINAGCRVECANLDDSILARFITVFKHSLPKLEAHHRQFAYGHGGGSLDGIVYNVPDAPKTPHLLEIKTSKTSKFITMKNQGVQKANFVHFIQMQIYMHLYKLKRALYIMVCKETDQRHYERIKYDPKIAKEYISIGEKIVESEFPPPRFAESSDYPPCKWCDFKRICHSGELPIRTCRTCRHVDIKDNGVWFCTKKNKKRSAKGQAKACSNYKLIERI